MSTEILPARFVLLTTKECRTVEAQVANGLASDVLERRLVAECRAQTAAMGAPGILVLCFEDLVLQTARSFGVTAWVEVREFSLTYLSNVQRRMQTAVRETGRIPRQEAQLTPEEADLVYAIGTGGAFGGERAAKVLWSILWNLWIVPSEPTPLDEYMPKQRAWYRRHLSSPMWQDAKLRDATARALAAGFVPYGFDAGGIVWRCASEDDKAPTGDAV